MAAPSRIARAANLIVGRAAYETAARLYPKERIDYRDGARIRRIEGKHGHVTPSRARSLSSFHQSGHSPAPMSPASPIAQNHPHRKPPKAARLPQRAAQSRWPYANGGGGAAGQAAFAYGAQTRIGNAKCAFGGPPERQCPAKLNSWALR